MCLFQKKRSSTFDKEWKQSVVHFCNTYIKQISYKSNFVFLSKPVSTGVNQTFQSLPGAARCLSGRRSCYSRRSLSPWIFCTAHQGAASPDVPSLCFLLPGRQGNTGLGEWIEKTDKLTMQRKKNRDLKAFRSMKDGKGSVWVWRWRHFQQMYRNKYLFLDGHSHIRFDLA